jgi:hypothetical protein
MEELTKIYPFMTKSLDNRDFYYYNGFKYHLSTLLSKGYDINDCVHQLILGVNFIYSYEYLKFCVNFCIKKGAVLNYKYLIDNCHIFQINTNITFPNNFNNRSQYIFTLLYRYSIIGRLIDDISINYISKKQSIELLNQMLPFGSNSTNNIIFDYYDIGLDNYDWNNIVASNEPLYNGVSNVKLFSIKLNVIKYYSKVLRHTFANQNDEEYIDHTFKDWDSYIDVRLNKIKNPFMINNNKIYNEYLLYLSYFYSFNNKYSIDISLDLYLEDLLKLDNFDAQIGYDKYMDVFSKLPYTDIIYFLNMSTSEYYDNEYYDIHDINVIYIIKTFKKHNINLTIDLNQILNLYSMIETSVNEVIFKLSNIIDNQTLFNIYIKLILKYNDMNLFIQSNYNGDLKKDLENGDLKEDLSYLIKNDRLWYDDSISSTLGFLINNVDILFESHMTTINNIDDFILEISNYEMRGYLIDIISNNSTDYLTLKKSVDKYYKTNKIKSIDFAKNQLPNAAHPVERGFTPLLPYKTYEMNRLGVLKFNSKYLQKILS